MTTITATSPDGRTWEVGSTRERVSFWENRAPPTSRSSAGVITTAILPCQRRHHRARILEHHDRLDPGRTSGGRRPRGRGSWQSARPPMRAAPEARLPSRPCRALVDAARVEPETGDEQEAGRKEKDEPPVGERAGEQPASDRRVALDEDEPEVDRGVPGSGGVGAGLEDSPPFDPAREPPGDRRLGLYLDRPRLERIWSISHASNPRPTYVESSISAGSSVSSLSTSSSPRVLASK